jgi:RNA polymerase sigma-70 factor (ECF subfamily)
MDRTAADALEAAIARELDRADMAAAATKALEGYGPQVLGYLAVVLRNEDDATEVFGRFAEELWKAIGGFRRESTFRTWSYRVAWSCARRFLEDPYRRLGRRLETAEISQLVDRVRTTTAPYLRDTVKGRVSMMREGLLPEEQALLVLRLDRGMSWGEVAHVLSRDGEDAPAAAALRKRFERIKQKLKQRAREEGLLE